MDGSNKKLLTYINLCMNLLNLIIILFIAGILIITTLIIKDNFKAREFFNTINTVPNNPWLITAVSLGSFFGLLTLIDIRKKIKKADKLVIHFAFATLEMALCLIIVFSLDLSYNGIILLVIANLLESFKDNKNRTIFLAFMFIIYMFTDYDLISQNLPIVSLQSYISQYNAGVRTYLIGIKNILSSLNIIIFILYVFFLMQDQKKENLRILQLNEQLNLANEQLKDYAAVTEKMGETKERNRLAREIHDTLGHSLTEISVGIDACLTMIDISIDKTKKQLELIADVARQGIKDVRRSVNQLRPDALEHLALEDAILKLVHDTQRVTDSRITFICEVEKLKFNSDEEDAIYRVIQESITNSVRHGHADNIEIKITKKAQRLTLTIRDNGIGCNHIKKGFGLIHMEERIHLLKGTLSYEGNSGFTIIAIIPIRWGEEYD